MSSGTDDSFHFIRYLVHPENLVRMTQCDEVKPNGVDLRYPLLWLATEPARLSKTAVDAIDDEANERLLAAQAIGGPFRFITVDTFILDDLG